MQVMLILALAVLASTGSTVSSQPGVVERLTAANDAARREFAGICERARRSSEFFGSANEQQLRAQLSSPLPDLEETSDREETVDTEYVALLEAGDAQLLVQLTADAVRLGDFTKARRLARLTSALLQRNDLVGAFGERRPAMEQVARSLEGTAWLLEAEDRNCLLLNQAASCILPIAPEAVHQDQTAILEAIRVFDRLVAADPSDPEAVWLLNLAHMLAGSYPDSIDVERRIPAERFAPAASGPPPPTMLNLAPALGVDVQDLAGGAVVDDFDGDGLLDLISSSWDPCSPLRAFRADGQGGYREVTAEWGLDGQLGGLNLMHADADGDGALDLLVLRGAWRGREGQVRNSLLINRLADVGSFEDVTYAAGLAYPAYPTQAAGFADYDLDGDLDLYVGNESAATGSDFLAFDPGRRSFPSQLFRNEGLRDGVPVFRDVGRAAGVQNHGFAKGVAWGDIDDDGDADLFVSNIGANRLYLNLGDGRFREESVARGLAGETRNFAAFFFDVDNDGDPDLFNADYSVPTQAVAASLVGKPVEVGHPRLYLNQDGRFEDISTAFGLTAPHLPMGANHGDLDGDGWEDLYLGTGLPAFTAIHPNVFYRNLGGVRFEDQTFASRLGHLQKGHGVAFADLDHDGDLDVFEQLGGAYPYDTYGNALYRNPTNDGGAGHRYLTLELRGVQSNSYAIGAEVTVEIEESSGATGADTTIAEVGTGEPAEVVTVRRVVRTVTSGGSFGGSSFRLEIGLGQASAIRSVTVRWPRRPAPDGSEPLQTFGSGTFLLDRAYRLIEGRDPVVLDLPRFRFRPARATSQDHGEHHGAAID